MRSIAGGSLIGLLALAAFAASPVQAQSSNTYTWEMPKEDPGAADIPAPVGTRSETAIETQPDPSAAISIPPSSQEADAGDPLSFDTPTPPRFNRSIFGPGGTPIPGGAMSGTGSGTGPASNPSGAWPESRY